MQQSDIIQTQTTGGYRPYALDRHETDNRHGLGSVKQLYCSRGWYKELTKEQVGKLFKGGLSAEFLDNKYAVDYVFIDSHGVVRFVQERLRPARYSNYNDITIRYRRNGDKKLTELYKIGKFIKDYAHKQLIYTDSFADFYDQDEEPSFWLFYAFVDDSTGNVIKHVCLNLRVLYELIETGKIIPIEKGTNYYNVEHGYWDENSHVFYAPIIADKDGSAEMLSLNIPMLVNHFETKEGWISAIGNWCL